MLPASLSQGGAPFWSHIFIPKPPVGSLETWGLFPATISSHSFTEIPAGPGRPTHSFPHPIDKEDDSLLFLDASVSSSTVCEAEPQKTEHWPVWRLSSDAAAPQPPQPPTNPLDLSEWEKGVVWATEVEPAPVQMVEEEPQPVSIVEESDVLHIDLETGEPDELPVVEMADQDAQEERPPSPPAPAVQLAPVDALQWSQFPHTSKELDSGHWEEAVVWDPSSPPSHHNRLLIDMNDPDLLLLPLVSSRQHARSSRGWGRTGLEGASLMASKDSFYDRVTSQSERRDDNPRRRKVVRVHGLPAEKLDPRVFPSMSTRWELTHFHRPISISFEKGTGVMSLSSAPLPRPIPPLRPLRPFEDPASPAYSDEANPVKTLADVSAARPARVVLFEYMEENPPLLPNPSMASLVLNFYRRLGTHDPHVPRAPDGRTALLNPHTRGPFLGMMTPGQTQLALENNMTLSPLFPHSLSEELFLLVRTDDHSISVRELSAVYTVGQQLPKMEVMPPGSYRHVNHLKQRSLTELLRRMTVRKQQSGRPFVNSRDIAFLSSRGDPVYLRQTLRDLASERGSLWVPKSSTQLPPESELRSMIRPEAACVHESMRAAEFRLESSGVARFSDTNAVAAAVAQAESEGVTDLARSGKAVASLVALAPWNHTEAFNSSERSVISQLRLSGQEDPRLGLIYQRSERMDLNRPQGILQPGQYAGTAADLRKLTLFQAKSLLADLGLTVEEIEDMDHGERLMMIRKLSSEAVSSGASGTVALFARRQHGHYLSRMRNMHKMLQTIWEQQQRALSDPKPALLDGELRVESGDDEEEGGDDDLLDFGRDLEKEMAAQAKPALMFRKEKEAAAAQLRPGKAVDIDERAELFTIKQEQAKERAAEAAKAEKEEESEEEDDSSDSDEVIEVQRKYIKQTIVMRRLDGSQSVKVEYIRDPLRVAEYIREQRGNPHPSKKMTTKGDEDQGGPTSRRKSMKRFLMRRRQEEKHRIARDLKQIERRATLIPNDAYDDIGGDDLSDLSDFVVDVDSDEQRLAKRRQKDRDRRAKRASIPRPHDPQRTHRRTVNSQMNAFLKSRREAKEAEKNRMRDQREALSLQWINDRPMDVLEAVISQGLAVVQDSFDSDLLKRIVDKLESHSYASIDLFLDDLPEASREAAGGAMNKDKEVVQKAVEAISLGIKGGGEPLPQEDLLEGGLEAWATTLQKGNIPAVPHSREPPAEPTTAERALNHLLDSIVWMVRQRKCSHHFLWPANVAKMASMVEDPFSLHDIAEKARRCEYSTRRQFMGDLGLLRVKAMTFYYGKSVLRQCGEMYRGFRDRVAKLDIELEELEDAISKGREANDAVVEWAMLQPVAKDEDRVPPSVVDEVVDDGEEKRRPRRKEAKKQQGRGWSWEVADDRGPDLIEPGSKRKRTKTAKYGREEEDDFILSSESDEFSEETDTDFTDFDDDDDSEDVVVDSDDEQIALHTKRRSMKKVQKRRSRRALKVYDDDEYEYDYSDEDIYIPRAPQKRARPPRPVQVTSELIELWHSMGMRRYTTAQEDERPLDIARMFRGVTAEEIVAFNKVSYPGLSLRSQLQRGTILYVPPEGGLPPVNDDAAERAAAAASLVAPTIVPCRSCGGTSGSSWVGCDKCSSWFHMNCTDLKGRTTMEVAELGSWLCEVCRPSALTVKFKPSRPLPVVSDSDDSDSLPPIRWKKVNETAPATDPVGLAIRLPPRPPPPTAAPAPAPPPPTAHPTVRLSLKASAPPASSRPPIKLKLGSSAAAPMQPLKLPKMVVKFG